MFNSDMFLKFATFNEVDGLLIHSDLRKEKQNRKFGYIYALTIGNDMYVGNTSDLLARTKRHLDAFCKGKNGAKLQFAFLKEKSFEVYLLMRVGGERWDWSLAEQFFISLFNPSLNSISAKAKSLIKEKYVWTYVGIDDYGKQ